MEQFQETLTGMVGRGKWHMQACKMRLDLMRLKSSFPTLRDPVVYIIDRKTPLTYEGLNPC